MKQYEVINALGMSYVRFMNILRSGLLEGCYKTIGSRRHFDFEKTKKRLRQFNLLYAPTEGEKATDNE